MSTEELSESELGTREYWDERYKEEVNNYKNYGDVGDIWFGEDIAERIVNWMERNISKNSTVLDVGCGNGMLLVYLAQIGYKNLTGVDYSEGAISLSREVTKKHEANVQLLQCDILEDTSSLHNSYDIILDKGTYDAVSLTKNAKESRGAYIKNVYKCLKGDGLLLIASCNWTKDELEVQFEDSFKVFSVIPTPEFKFGGKIGNVVTCLVLKKK